MSDRASTQRNARDLEPAALPVGELRILFPGAVVAVFGAVALARVLVG